MTPSQVVFGAAVSYGAMSLLTFAFYAADKRAAHRASARIRERTLNLLTLAGGFPGAWLGQRLLRHKTQHQGMVALTWAALVLHALAGIAWFNAA